jgi:hypothetical protein
VNARGVIWVLATTVGLVMAGFLFHFPGSFGGLYGWDPTAVIFGGLIGFVSGAVVGLVQWAALLLRRNEGLRMLLWMGVGIGVTHAVHDGAPNTVGLVGAASVSGLAMAAAYAWSFRERQPIPIVVVGVAWAAALVGTDIVSRWLGTPWQDTPVGWSTDHAIDGIVVGLIWGIATALVGVPERLRAQVEPAPSMGLDPA